ncbi:MAG TPA: hypothetical protein PKI20_19445 [Verrucomicrobiota bacterium]|nr:hypothetical protein [Verrucomicrobiota bacterium]HQL79975.1 hypothetical protein [Verrucomicrobiota bacterium]
MMRARPKSRAVAWLSASLGVFVASSCAGADLSIPKGEWVAAARRNFEAAQAAYQHAPTQATAAWQFARACFDLAEYATNDTQRAAVAEQGIAVCQRALLHATNSAPLHYYLGMNLGQLARTRLLGALKLVTQMEREFIRVRDLDRQFDYAGADRNLGLLYRDAPAIGSIGSRPKARGHLVRAVRLAPQYPENRLNLIETHLKWGEPNSARRELAALEEIWPAARTNLIGAAWAASWADWEPRLMKLRNRIERPQKAAGAPHEKN